MIAFDIESIWGEIMKVVVTDLSLSLFSRPTGNRVLRRISKKYSQILGFFNTLWSPGLDGSPSAIDFNGLFTSTSTFT